MALIDQIEMLGIAVEEGLIDRDDAAELLAEYSNGGFTKRGALHTLDNHRGMRQRNEEAIADVAAAIKAIHAVETASTPEEFLAAHDAMLAEMARQRAALLERQRQRILDNLRRDLPGDEH